MGYDGGWVDGNTAYMPETEEYEVPSRGRERHEGRQSVQAPAMNVSYVLFLAVAAILTVAVCVNYLKLQNTCTLLQEEATSLESTYSSLKLQNDEEYNRIISSVDLEEIKEEAMNRLGMVYASESQVVTYEAAGGDYVKQYSEIPTGD